jgi:UDP-N-acetylglucosamine transferase subunit ALG13
MQRGFVLMDIGNTKDSSGRKVFFFKKSIQIEDAIKDYKQITNK